MATGSLQGIFTPNMVPLDRNGNINEVELRRIVDFLVDRGVHGLYPNGSTGEFTRFSMEERHRVVEIVADQVAGRVKILAGAAEGSIRDTLISCEAYAKYGCDAAALCGPYYFNLSPENVREHYAEIARNTPIDIVLYNIPQFSNEISIPTVMQLLDFERIVGIKDSSRDFPRFLNMLAQIKPVRPEFSCLIGTEEILMPSLIMGGDGGTIATSGIVPEVVVKLYHLTVSGQLDEARQIQFKLLELINAMLFGVDFPEGFRAALTLRGFNMGESRQKLSMEQQCDVEGVRESLHCILNEHGFIGDLVPWAGCDVPPSRAVSSMSDDQLQTVVQEVVRQLQQGSS